MKLRKPWSQRTDDELWRQVLAEVLAIGRAEPGERSQYDPKIKPLVSIKRLKQFRNDIDLQKYLHELFRRLNVRYVGSNWKGDKKAIAAVRNFRRLTDGTTPREFFEGVAKFGTETEMIEALQVELNYFGRKAARDTLIELGLATNCMALDARIYGLLAKVGVKVSPDDIYRQIEKELIQKVAKPLGMSGALLDRALFQNYDRILEQR